MTTKQNLDFADKEIREMIDTTGVVDWKMPKLYPILFSLIETAKKQQEQISCLKKELEEIKRK